VVFTPEEGSLILAYRKIEIIDLNDFFNKSCFYLPNLVNFTRRAESSNEPFKHKFQ